LQKQNDRAEPAIEQHSPALLDRYLNELDIKSER